MTRFGPDTTAAELRKLAFTPADLASDVERILAAVRAHGDAAVRELTEQFDGVKLESLRVPGQELEADAGAVEPGVIDALGVAVANVGAVADAQLRDPLAVDLPQGQRVEIVELPVRRAAAYVPGGRAAYPSTVVMCAVTARAAGVEELAVCAPPGPDGAVHPAILAACALCGVTEVYRMGGAQAIAALAYGTESVPAVDVIVGPGNSYVQEAKRQLAGTIGIDSVAGPSELVVVASADADPALVALDLLAQAEHGPDSLVAAISPDEKLLAAVENALDGTGQGTRTTGVGFFDHLLDAVAKHGGLDLDVQVEGDLQTGPHHTVEDTGIALGQALDQALGDRAGIVRFGQATVPMDEARASAAIDISGRPYTAFEGDLPHVAIADFDSDLAEEFFRAVANSAKLTLHVQIEAGSNAHHMVEASFKAFARALRAAVAIDPSSPGIPSTKGLL